MASTSSSSSSGSEEKIWVDEMIKIFNHQLHFRPPASIFLLPKLITKQKPEAYEPQHLGLGPQHHIRLKHNKFENIKQVFVKSVLEHNKVVDFKEVVFEIVRKLLPSVRPCYDSFLSIDDDHLSWNLAVDGCFLLYFFYTYNPGMGNENNPLPQHNDLYEHTISLDVGTGSRLLAEEILMEENQIPFIVLKKINKALYQSSGNSKHSGIKLLLSGFRSFCMIHSPLILCDISVAPTYNVEHLLHYMYSSIIKNVPLDRGKETKKVDKKVDKKGDEKDSNKKDEKKPADSKMWVGQTAEFIGKIPQNEIAHLYKQTVQTLETICQSKVAIPSASNLHNRAGFKFCLLTQDQGIKKIDIKGKDFYLPCVTLNEDSEVILRNLVAYEMLRNIGNFPLCEYVRLMSGLIMNVKDVKLLKKENIIKGDLSDEEVIKLFIEVSSSISSMKQKKKSLLQGKIDEVNKVYESTPRVKMYLFLKKLAYWLLVVLKPVGGFVEASWKIVAFIFSIVMVILLTFQAYCDVYGCDKTKVTLMPYTSS